MEVGLMMHLAAVAGGHVSARAGDERVEFCSYCGQFDGGNQRVCPNCGLGVMLETDGAVLDAPGSPFVVVRSDGRISAVSEAAERLLGKQDSLIGRPLLSLITGPGLARMIALAGYGHGGPYDLQVERLGGGRLRATIGTCGRPRAALVVFGRP
jgi:PAS domain-containing protein